MLDRTLLARSTATVGITAAILLAGGTSAQAADLTPDSECAGDGPDISVSDVADRYIPGDFRAYGDGGAVLTIAAGQSSTARADVSVSGTLSADAVVASASVTAGVTLGVSETVSQQASASYTVPADLDGQYVELGAAGKAFSWSSSTYNRACVLVDQQSGSSTAPTDNPYFTKSW